MDAPTVKKRGMMLPLSEMSDGTSKLDFDSGITAPFMGIGRAISGKTPMWGEDGRTNPAVIKATTDAVTGIMTGTVPGAGVAAKGVTPALGTFFAPKSSYAMQPFNQKRISDAKSMLERGAMPEEAFHKTGVIDVPGRGLHIERAGNDFQIKHYPDNLGFEVNQNSSRGGFIETSRHGDKGYHQINQSFLNPRDHGTGLGQSMYEAAAIESLLGKARTGSMYSDRTVSDKAAPMYDKLRNRGYQVQRAPETSHMEFGTVVNPNHSPGVFKVQAPTDPVDLALAKITRDRLGMSSAWLRNNYPLKGFMR